jgi:hypothetical protein
MRVKCLLKALLHVLSLAVSFKNQNNYALKALKSDLEIGRVNELKTNARLLYNKE